MKGCPIQKQPHHRASVVPPVHPKHANGRPGPRHPGRVTPLRCAKSDRECNEWFFFRTGDCLAESASQGVSDPAPAVITAG